MIKEFLVYKKEISIFYLKKVLQSKKTVKYLNRMDLITDNYFLINQIVGFFKENQNKKKGLKL